MSARADSVITMSEQHLVIDGFGPVPVVRPETVPALATCVCEAAAQASELPLFRPAHM